MIKTLFLTIFEGAEARNLLRTSVAPTLLSDPEVRIVLFTKSPDRVEYYKKEFSDPRLIYEVVAPIKVEGLDKFFAFLKFLLLKTETTDLRRSSRFSLFASWLLARPAVRRMVRFLDYHLVRNSAYSRYFDAYKPDAVLLAHLFDEPEIHLLREAKKRRVKTIGFVNSWDKVTARCILRLLPDKAVVFNDVVKKEMMEHNEMAEKDIFVSGLPQYDSYFMDKNYTSREVFFNKLNLDPRKKLIVYAPLGRTCGESDWDIIDLLYRLRDSGRFGDGADLLVRFQPNDFLDEAELKKRPHLKYDYPGTRFSSTRGIDWDMNAEHLKHLRDTLHHMSLLVCYASSVSIDAAIFDKPIININFETRKPDSFEESSTKYYSFTHYKKALATGGIRLASSEEELVAAIKEYLADSSPDREGRKRLVREQCQFVDGKAGERIGKFILEPFKTQ
ncbi:MAG: CDP-glycerol glycerophosphotransferase family protein [Candidatus Harrisonbacteria bacterium]|nr:CDP-glycerol glycerophosphotransferase family protein [Candidatus Harrisonbacteria bacterium]